MRLWVLKIVALLCIGFSLAVGAAVLTPVKAQGLVDLDIIWSDNSNENWYVSCHNQMNPTTGVAEFHTCNMMTTFAGSSIGDIVFLLSYDGIKDIHLRLCGHDWAPRVDFTKKHSIQFDWPGGFHRFEMNAATTTGKDACFYNLFKFDDGLENYLKLLIEKPNFELKIGNAPAISIAMSGFNEPFKIMTKKAIGFGGVLQ